MEYKYYIGIDEVGRGPIAGPVTVCAMLSFAGRSLEMGEGIRDSKKLTENGREKWFKKIKEARTNKILDFAIFSVGSKTIDKIGIVPSLKLCIKKCLEKLNSPADETYIILDGSLKAPANYKYQETIIRGDEKEPLIAMASIAAKVSRDWYMSNLPEKYNMYGLEKHKGYGTKAHYQAIKVHGISDMHRRTFLKSRSDSSDRGSSIR
ncbi:MAG: ribonuclease HII [bacterium]|nr:ribonuclease HII [bacterium]